MANAASTPPPVQGWTNGTVTCSNGIVSVFPLIISNATSVARTGSFMIPNPIAGAVQVRTQLTDINCNNAYGGGGINTTGSNFTVNAGDNLVLWIGLGSSKNQQSGSHNVALGGLPSGTSGQSW